MSQCPQCFTQLPPEPVALICTGTCQADHDEAASMALGFGVNSRPPVQPGPPAHQGGPPQGTCGACGVVTTTEACPTCRYEIPAMWRQSRVTTIAMAGARTTGKSLLVATLVMQLHLLAERQWKSPVEPIGTTQRRFRDIYEVPLLEQRSLMPPTDSMSIGTSAGREPLIFRFIQRYDDQSFPRMLVLKDVAGEDLESSDRDRRQFGFFSRADVVFVMVDPLKVAEIRAVLADVIPAPRQLGGDPLATLNNVLGHMTGHVPGARAKPPVALILSKFDVMHRLRDVASPQWSEIMSRAGSPMHRDPSLSSPTWDQHDGDLLHEEVRTLLHRLGVPLIESALRERTEYYRFFAASALGSPPDHEQLHPSGIAPFRVLDPLKWALSFT